MPSLNAPYHVQWRQWQRLGHVCLIAWLSCGLGCASHRPVAAPVMRAPTQQQPLQSAPPADVPVALAAWVRVALGERTTLLLLDVDSAAEQIATRDDFMRGLTLLDRQVRMKVVSNVDEAAFVTHARAQVRAFKPKQIAKLTKVAAEVGALLQAQDLARWLPREIKLVQTTGVEEGFPPAFDLSYTRAGVIYINSRALQLLSRQLLIHELFHILTTNHPAQREALFAAIGFSKIEAPQFPKELAGLSLTLPEVPQGARHAIRVRYKGESVLAVPLCVLMEPYAGAEMYEVAASRWAILDKHGIVRSLAEVGELEQLFEQVGKNTTALSGPDEILAENFVMLVLGTDKAASPEVLTRMRAILTGPVTSSRP